jgi:hypothetical protein
MAEFATVPRAISGHPQKKAIGFTGRTNGTLLDLEVFHYF